MISSPQAEEPQLSRGFTLEVHFTDAARRRELLAEARAGLTAPFKELSPKWLYDARGSELFEEITRLPEYYPTRRERAILRACAAQIAHTTRAETLVELGSGSSEKTRLLMDALSAEATLSAYVSMDLSSSMLQLSAAQVAREYPWIAVHGVVGDFERHLHLLPRRRNRLLAFLGGTIGNLKVPQREKFFRALHDQLEPGEHFLLGTDLIKDRARLHAAYDDSRGITAAFNLNVLRVLNRELESEFDPAFFSHEARFSEIDGWIEMLLVSRTKQEIEIPALGIEVAFGRGETLRTEVSTKFRREQVEEEAARAELTQVGWWTDVGGDFALSLWRR